MQIPTPGAPAANARPTTAPPTPGPAPDAPPPPQADAPRRRGRPFGSTSRPRPLTETPVGEVGAVPPDVEPNKRRRRTKAVDKEQLAKQLIGIHAIAAKVTGLPFVQIDQTEAGMLADAIDSVAREYDLALDGKTGAFIQLMAAAAMVYGPRVLIFQSLKRRAARGETPVTVDGVATPTGEAVNGAHTAA